MESFSLKDTSDSLFCIGMHMLKTKGSEDIYLKSLLLHHAYDWMARVLNSDWKGEEYVVDVFLSLYPYIKPLPYHSHLGSYTSRIGLHLGNESMYIGNKHLRNDTELLMFAIYRNQHACVCEMVRVGFGDVNGLNVRGYSVFGIASFFHAPPNVLDAIWKASGKPIDEPDSHGDTGLMLLCRRGPRMSEAPHLLESIDWFSKQGADFRPMLARYIMSGCRNQGTMEKLIRAGADVNYVRDFNGPKRALDYVNHYAPYSREVSIGLISFLMRFGATLSPDIPHPVMHKEIFRISLACCLMHVADKFKVPQEIIRVLVQCVPDVIVDGTQNV